MSSFVQPSFPAQQHLDVARVESSAMAAKQMRRGFDGTKGLSTILLAAMVSSLVVVADQLVETWADGHLLMAWVALWAVCFAAIALFSGAALKLAMTAVGALDAWAHRVALARADARLWAIAKTDPRVMADFKAILARSEDEGL